MGQAYTNQTNSSEEDLSQPCDPCSFQDINIEAGSFCTDCLEYLCSSCEKDHRRSKATRGHGLKMFYEKIGNTVEQRALISSITTCDVHNTNSLTEYCFSHKEVICSRCCNMEHKHCEVENVKDVSQKSQTKTDVKLFLETARTLLKKIKEMKDSRKSDKQQILNDCEEAKLEVQEMEMEFVEWIEGLAKNMLDQISDVEEKLTTDADNDIKTAEDMDEQLECILEKFDILEDSDDDARFILMTNEKRNVTEGKETIDEIVEQIKLPDLKFHRSDTLVDLMAETTEIGSLEWCHPQSSVRKTTANDTNVTWNLPINVKDIKSLIKQDIDTGSSNVTGCVFMPDGRAVVCEGHGSLFVKLFSPDFKLECERKIISVWDVAVVSNNQVIVTQRDQQRLQFLNFADKIEDGKAIFVDMRCYGVDCKNDRLYVSCHDNDERRGEIKVLTMSGDTVSSVNITQGRPFYLTVNGTASRIVVCSWSNYTEYVDTQGTLLYKYTDCQLDKSLGVLFDSHNNFLVCGQYSNNIQLVNTDGTKHKILLTSDDGIHDPFCIGYRNSDHALIVGQFCGSPTGLLVFKAKYSES